MDNQSSISSIERFIEHLLSLLSVRRVIVSLLILLFLLAWNRGIALIYGLAFFLLAILLISYAISFFVVSTITINRQHEAIAYEGKPTTLHYHLTNHGRAPRYMLEIKEALAFAVPEQQHVQLLITTIEKQSTASISVTCDQRGLHSLGALNIESGWPFDLFRSQKTLALPDSQLLIYPEIFPIMQLPLLGTSFFQHDGWLSDRRKGGQDLFLGVREYRAGDSLRHVHWSLSAKQGELMTKEYENISRTEICILLNLNSADHIGQGKHSTLEYAVKIAASIAHFAIQQGHFVSLYGTGKNDVEIEPGCGISWLDKILYSLALVQANGSEPYENLIRREVKHGSHKRLFLLFDHRMNSLQIRALGIQLTQALVIRFNDKTFLNMLPNANTSFADGSLLIQKDDNLAEKVRTWQAS